MQIQRILICGGANGIGLSIATEIAKDENCDKVYIIDKNPLANEYKQEKIESYVFDLTQSDYSFFDRFTDINALIITAGFGHLSLFRDIKEETIINYFNVNTIPVLRLIKRFYHKLESKDVFYCGVMVSIAGFMSAPFFSVYGATKAALKIFIESINVELNKAGTNNRILNISPGSLKGTSFNNEKTELNVTAPMAQVIIKYLENQEDLFIPEYEETFKEVLERYHNDFRAEGIHSYEYKIQSGRIKN